MRRDRGQEPIIIIRKKGRHAAHHGGAWKVAFADFMTAMFALFLVLWLINQSSDIKAAIAGYFQDPLGRADEHGSSIIQGSGAQAQTIKRALSQADVMTYRKDRLQHFADELEDELGRVEGQSESALKEHIEMTMTDDGLRIDLIEDAAGFFFESGAAVPSVAGQKILELLGAELGALTIEFPVRIEGHTDAHPFKTNTRHYTNWELSADRANAARRIMGGSGLRQEQVTEVLALADRQPRIPDNPFSARNRRVSITMLLEGFGIDDTVDSTAVDVNADDAGQVGDPIRPDSESPASSGRPH